MNAAALRRRLADDPAQPDWRVEVVDETDSTNSRLWEAIGGGGPLDRPWAVLWAGWQSAGRGRGVRGWDCRPGEGLLVSLRLDLELADHVLSLLGHWAAAALCAALEPRLAASPREARLRWKWPNDVWLEDGAGAGKLAGLLIQTQLQGPRARAVVGIGLNVGQRGFPADLRQPARSLALAGVDAPLDELLGDLLLEMGRRGLPRPDDHLLRELDARDLFQSRALELAEPAGLRPARAQALPDGSLRLVWPEGEAVLAGGGVRVLAVEPARIVLQRES